MPQTIAQRVHPAAVRLVHDAIVLVEVRDVGERFVLEPFVRIDDAAADFGDELASAEPRCERGLLIVGERLLANHHHRVAVHQRAQLAKPAIVECAHVDAGELAHEQRMKRCRFQRRRAGVRRHAGFDGSFAAYSCTTAVTPPVSWPWASSSR